MYLKAFLPFIFFIGLSSAKAQEVESIHVNLYTDSLKKGTYNYINIDGLLTNGSYLPLDTTSLIFTCSAGEFHGNSLWIDKDFAPEKVSVKVILKKKPELTKNFDIYVKQKPDNEKLKTTEEILNELRNQRKSKKS